MICLKVVKCQLIKSGIIAKLIMKKNTKTELSILKEQAFSLMEKAGFPINNVAVVLDENLPYMGHTVEIDNVPVVVVSSMALSSGMGLSLIIHELGHVYRTQTKHPSHDSSLILSIISWVMHGKAIDPYQEEIVFSIINHLQDLYSDDIFFKIFDKSKGQDNINEFFLGWIHSPIKKVKSRKDSWKNAEYLLSASFAQANLYRHNVTDKGGLVEKAINDFLHQLNPLLAKKYDFFKKFMISLPEHVTDKEYQNLLIKYLSEFLKIANIR